MTTSSYAPSSARGCGRSRRRRSFAEQRSSARFRSPYEELAKATDEAALVERHGGRVRVVAAPRENLKVTTPLDLLVAEQLLVARAAD